MNKYLTTVNIWVHSDEGTSQFTFTDTVDKPYGSIAYDQLRRKDDIDRVDSDGYSIYIPYDAIVMAQVAYNTETKEDPNDAFCDRVGPEPGDRTVIYDGNVTTEDVGGGFSTAVVNVENICDHFPSELYVTFNGTQYTLPAIVGMLGLYGEAVEGMPSFDNYPLAVALSAIASEANIVTEEAGTYSVKIEADCEGPTLSTIYDGDAEFEDIDGAITARLEGAANPCPEDQTPSMLLATIDGTAYELSYSSSDDYYVDDLDEKHVIVELGITSVLVVLPNGEVGTHSVTIEYMSGDCIEKGGGPK